MPNGALDGSRARFARVDLARSDTVIGVSESTEVYDAVELRRRIVVAFTPGEMRELAEQLGVGGSIAWDRGAQEAARELVKQCERYAGLSTLVAKLREARPLVEWPEPSGTAASAPAFPAAAPVPMPAPFAAAAPAAPVGPAIADPFAPAAPTLASGPPPSTAFAPAVFPTTPGAVPPAAPSHVASPSPAPFWPEAPAPAPAQPRGIDPRILVAVAGLMLLAAVIAYLAGRASSASPTAGAAPNGSSVAATARRGDGPAAYAADALARSLDNVARTCEQRSAGGDGELVFRRVYERCGPMPLPTRPYSPPPPTPLPEPSASADDAPREPAARSRRPGRGGGDAPANDAPPPARGCMGACDADHRSCMSHCGPEPTDGAAEEGYRRCLGRCLADVSRCRLGCR
ncbi:Vegetative cell wall protein gp1 precursor (Hydroxyproline-rich glycoprotein 1) [Minicystis rosea]|nr:Vegetative cell wall protein gp1 precursor (Hydroxyproline-rich glycoprotein 1) [Minicystis rosea]